MKKINPQVDTFRGINNALNPCSAAYRQMQAYDAQNSRLNESGLWDKPLIRASASLGSHAVSALPVTFDECVCHWKMNETSGTTMTDAQGSHNGTYSSAATGDGDRTGAATGGYNFGGSKYSTVTDHADFSRVESEMSIAGWVYVAASDADQMILTKSDATTGSQDREWSFYVTSEEKLCLLLFDESSDGFIYATSTAMAAGWHFVVGIYDGSGAETGLTLYVDNVEDTDAQAESGTFTAMEAGATNVLVGATYDSTGAEANFFANKMDNLMFFNKELTAQEVAFLYNNKSDLTAIEDYVFPHFKELTILDNKKIVKYLGYNTSVAIGPNKYAYAVSDDLGSSRAVYWWDGTTKASAAAFTNNTTARNYDLAGMGRPDSESNAIVISDNGQGDYGGRQEAGMYYYMFTLYDSQRQAESLPSDIYTHSVGSDVTDNTTVFPVIRIAPDSAHDPSTGSGRYDTDTKVRLYRSRLTSNNRSIYNSPTDFYFVEEISYAAVLTGLTYDHTGNGEGEKHLEGGAAGVFSNMSAGDYLYLDGTGNVADDIYEIASVGGDGSYVLLTADGGLTGDDTVSAYRMCINDKLNDSELIDQYEGRGSPPPTDIDCLAPHNNRMYYFKDNIVRWSSSGRPDEVAQEYTLTFAGTYTSTTDKMPLLSTGDYAEAKYEIAELAGQSVIAAYSYNGKLWVFAENAIGYLENNGAIEGVTFTLLRRGVGLASEKLLVHSPYGLFGADREGVWVINNRDQVGRLSKNIIDIDTSTKSTYVQQSSISHCFGFWSPVASEYVLCTVNAGTATPCRQFSFQPLRGIFGGIYAYTALHGGCSIYTTAGSQCYTTGGYTLDDSSYEPLTQTLQFWMGQHSLESIKNKVEIETIFESITASKTVSITVYQNNIASTTGATTSSTFSVTSSSLVGIAKPTASGRMFMISISIPSDCQAPLIAVNYQANSVLWDEKHGR